MENLKHGKPIAGGVSLGLSFFGFQLWESFNSTTYSYLQNVVEFDEAKARVDAFVNSKTNIDIVYSGTASENDGK